MNISNPFKLIDGLLLDYVFNPLAWWSEYRYGKDAMDLRLIASYLGCVAVAFVAVQEKMYLMIMLIAVFASLNQCR